MPEEVKRMLEERRADLSSRGAVVGPAGDEREQKYAINAAELDARIKDAHRRAGLVAPCFEDVPPYSMDQAEARLENAYEILMLEYRRMKRENIALQRRLDAALLLRSGGSIANVE